MGQEVVVQEEATPMVVAGYSPAYTSEDDANKASGDGTSTSHTINGITYYIPAVNEDRPHNT